jgi:hypothetical protein
VALNLGFGKIAAALCQRINRFATVPLETRPAPYFISTAIGVFRALSREWSRKRLNRGHPLQRCGRRRAPEPKKRSDQDIQSCFNISSTKRGQNEAAPGASRGGSPGPSLVSKHAPLRLLQIHRCRRLRHRQVRNRSPTADQQHHRNFTRRHRVITSAFVLLIRLIIDPRPRR